MIRTVSTLLQVAKASASSSSVSLHGRFPTYSVTPFFRSPFLKRDLTDETLLLRSDTLSPNDIILHFRYTPALALEPSNGLALLCQLYTGFPSMRYRLPYESTCIFATNSSPTLSVKESKSYPGRVTRPMCTSPPGDADPPSEDFRYCIQSSYKIPLDFGLQALQFSEGIDTI